MPEKDYNFLSERERRYLTNPDHFEPQTKAEIAYRIRKKIDGYIEDLDLLKDTYREWALRTPEDADTILFCKKCENSINIGPDSYSHLAEITSLPNDYAHPEGWVNVETTRGLEVRGKYHKKGIEYYRGGFCPDCWDNERVIEEAKQSGKVPCHKSNCNQHRIDSNPFEDHRKYIPISKDKMKEIRSVL